MRTEMSTEWFVSRLNSKNMTPQEVLDSWDDATHADKLVERLAIIGIGFDDEKFFVIEHCDNILTRMNWL